MNVSQQLEHAFAERLTICAYREQQQDWPKSGRHILAQFDDNSIVVYQAYRASIGRFAAQHQQFGGDFSFSRMSWIKPNFLWMMYRSGWAAKEGQEHVLAIRIRRKFFDEILEQAVASSFGSSGMESHDQWRSELAFSDVRLQWDPDHDPAGNSVERRAIQLGLRGTMLRRFATEEVLSIDDISEWVRQQSQFSATKDCGKLRTPVETVYQPSKQAADNVGLDR